MWTSRSVTTWKVVTDGVKGIEAQIKTIAALTEEDGERSLFTNLVNELLYRYLKLQKVANIFGKFLQFMRRAARSSTRLRKENRMETRRVLKLFLEAIFTIEKLAF